MTPLIAQHFANKDFDLRKKFLGYSRYMDQKVTPDVLAFIADCILNLPEGQSFTVRNIWESDYFEKNTKAIFGKPAPSNDSAFSEYNKFIGQPLKTLAYAQVLSETKNGQTNQYAINNKELLEYISLNERGALDFLCEYLIKVLTDSGFYSHFETYRDQVSVNRDSGSFDTLKQRFQRFMRGNTEINGILEINRIFPKVLNPLAVKENIPGSEKGHMTKHPFMFSELMYNRTNFRDLKKAKGVSRQEAIELVSEQRQQEDFTEYRITKAMELIKRKYTASEIRDKWADGPATYVHHIFPRARYRKYAAHTENLIKLTAEQHYGHAHPSARTQEVDPDYQIQCLLAKCDSIEESLRNGEFIYSKDSFISMINTCLGLEIDSKSSFDDLRKALARAQTKA
ncbi:MAG: hypothetical protein COT91_04170 [Candidatus Doudnabacteria bacterium CG10_big_fil_rev_8_21_14_0_10_41_10]|uniref:Restriction endonuclease n=1 Tax=Candidatus Doudnabacteria bacterium CG10_big_fil_rev_8_21_14_0_10_41_10 TaxID=1974551 RepID=A0A2H0VCS0_9BACT|nr:MAG: hypothetical protein COT91_04170 [Candidatus Doudnabacteria bacterium CG10_big_fil_rev_8_21_14_0_10_41_10]